MKTKQKDANSHVIKSDKKQQGSSYVDIGTPKVPIKKRPTKEAQESLSDWAHAS
ncbi:MAG: hypothetical protein IGS39_09885 [Calothrix sp. C42_A2020_038]|nr:hypothetical protein [Calothrix sp. C42_A2020_038]